MEMTKVSESKFVLISQEIKYVYTRKKMKFTL